MDVMIIKNGTKRKGLIKKTLERCKSLASGMMKKGGLTSNDLIRKSKSFPCISSSSREGNEGSTSCNIKKINCCPEGCFSVYVGPEKQRFVIKTEYVNHPLFKMLLEEAESEYGYNCGGPLVLPCEVSFFVKVLAEMDSKEENDELQGGGGVNHCSPYYLLTPPRMIAINQF
ncbi:hypothetical protein LIER_39045 [Lithospermum erythrorhizon]|uniref:Uncharacterized protein n=1 Tax=Lithospermum erythrorhizon TaxID=34254 RepID=A0AAV3QAF5_LITER